MQFRIRHLLVITFLTGAGIAYLDWSAHSTALIQLSSPGPVIPFGPPELELTPSRYWLAFSAAGKSRTVQVAFGFNDLFGTDIQLENLSELDDISIPLRYRSQPRPWSAAETLEEAVLKYLDCPDI